MMITDLSTHAFRGLTDQQLNFSPGFNVFVGQNGSGKTSVLEGLHYVCTQKSFRTSKPAYLIQEGKDQLTLRAGFSIDEQVEKVAYQRDRAGNKHFHRQKDVEASFVDWARLVPVLFMDTASHRALAEVPALRRHMIDWTLFYLKPAYALDWKRFQRILKQRNAALKTDDSSLDYWDNALVEAASVLDDARMHGCAALESELQALLVAHHALGVVRLVYDRGWAKNQTYVSVLKKNRQRDQASGYTHWGPHRADIQILCDGVLAHQRLSQGQMKMLHMMLLIYQMKMKIKMAWQNMR